MPAMVATEKSIGFSCQFSPGIFKALTRYPASKAMMKYPEVEGRNIRWGRLWGKQDLNLPILTQGS